MRSRIIVLLAVCSNVATAGILRYNKPRAQHHNAARFLNNTQILSIAADIQTSTTVPISSSLIIPSIASSTETSLFASTSSTATTATPLTPNVVSSSSPYTDLPTTSGLSQVLITSATLPTTISTAAGSKNSGAGSEIIPTSTEAAVVQPAETASRLFNLAETPSGDLQPSTNSQSFSSTPSPRFSASLSATSDISFATNIQDMAATTSSSTVKQAPSSFEGSLNVSATAGASHIMPYSTTSVPALLSNIASQSSSAMVIPVPISSGPVQVSAAGGGAAEEFAPVTLDSSSPAPTGTAKYPTAENGNAAMAAGYNSVYKTLNTDSPCNPSDPSQAYACVDGEIAECQSDGTYVLKSCPALQSCYALPKASGLTGIVVQCAVPSDAYSILAGLSSSTNASPSAVTTPPAETLQVGGGLSQTTQSVSVQSPVQPVALSPAPQTIIQSQKTTSIPVFAVTATPSPDQSSYRTDEASVSTGTPPTSAQSAIQSQPQAPNSPVPAITSTAQQAQDSNPLTNSPTSDTSPSVPSTTAAVETIPNALFAVVTAPQSGQASTEASTTSTSTSSADGASITSAPTGLQVNEKVAVGNGQAAVTVTVTVTTTERPAPVTIAAS